MNTQKKRASKGKSISELLSDYTVIDLETTGMSIYTCEIIELSAVRVRSDKPVETFSSLVRPKRSIPNAITRLTGITDKMTENAPGIADILPEYLSFIGSDVILGHNIASYDSNILYDTCIKLGLPPFSNDLLDTFSFAKKCDINTPDLKLTTLTEHFNISHENAHRALNDCLANHECYQELKKLYTGVSSKHTGKAVRETAAGGQELYDECSGRDSIDPAGKNIVLTGDFRIGTRDEVTSMLTSAGCKVTGTVSTKTDYLIVGSIAGSGWKNGKYGAKIAKAAELRQNGGSIRIIREVDFFRCLKVLT
ncbi:MAG: 3'-5' exoribonuclease [Ruminococcus sp.]|nr:3'-5' exoribonuclease [Ruminococcus sp.]